MTFIRRMRRITLTHYAPERIVPLCAHRARQKRLRAHKETSMFIKNTWYVAAWDKEVTTEGMFARTIIGVPVLMYRTSGGQLVALEDRCCPRGAPLSKGKREGDCVRCMYHGLKFDATGQCIEAPAQPRIPPKAKVRTFPVVQQHRWIWIWMGDPAKADPELIPQTPWLDHPDWRGLDGYIHYDVNY